MNSDSLPSADEETQWALENLLLDMMIAYDDWDVDGGNVRSWMDQLQTAMGLNLNTIEAIEAWKTEMKRKWRANAA